MNGHGAPGVRADTALSDRTCGYIRDYVVATCTEVVV